MSYEADDDTYPGKATVYVRAVWNDTIRVGSGALIGPNDVVTASHVIYDGALGGLADSITVYPSYDPDETFNASYPGVYFQYFETFDPDNDGRISLGDQNALTKAGSEQDIALISLSADLSDQYGYYGVSWDYQGGTASVLGHPGVYDNNLIYDDGSVTRSSVDAVYYNDTIEVNPGNSGGPVFYSEGASSYVFAVVSSGRAFTALSGHRDWLTQAIADNDLYISGRSEPSQVGEDEVFSGSDGKDTISLATTRQAANISITEQKVTISSIATGTDTLYDIEEVRFSDGVLRLDVGLYEKAGAAYRLYQAAFDRTPDTPGLAYWIGQSDAGAPLTNIAHLFLASEEFQQTYGATNDLQYISLLYNNVLSRTPDSSGYDFWREKLEASEMDRAEVLVNFSESVENQQLVADAIDNGIWLG